MEKMFARAITFGTFDLFHVGHVRLLRRASEIAHDVIVGVSTNELNYKKKGHDPVFSFEDRCEIVSACRHVSSVFGEHSLEEKRAYICMYDADVLIMGDDWEGKFDDLHSVCQVIYMPRTENVSTTSTVEIIKHL